MVENRRGRKKGTKRGCNHLSKEAEHKKSQFGLNQQKNKNGGPGPDKRTDAQPPDWGGEGGRKKRIKGYLVCRGEVVGDDQWPQKKRREENFNAERKKGVLGNLG